MSFRGGRFRGRRGGGGFDSFRPRDPNRKPPTGDLYPPLDEKEEAKPITLPLSEENRQLVAHQVDFRMAMRGSPYYLTRFDTIRKRSRASAASMIPDRYGMSGENSATSEKLDVLKQFVVMTPGLQPDELINPVPYKRHAKLLALKRKIERQGSGKNVDMDKLMEEIEAKEKQRAAGAAAGDEEDDENNPAGEDVDDLFDGIEEDEEDEDNGEDDYNLDNYGSDGDEFDDYRAERDEDAY